MKKIWCLLLVFSLALSMTACSQDTSQQQPPSTAQTPAEETKDSPKKYSSAQTQAELLWTTGIDPYSHSAARSRAAPKPTSAS